MHNGKSWVKNDHIFWVRVKTVLFFTVIVFRVLKVIWEKTLKDMGVYEELATEIRDSICSFLDPAWDEGKCPLSETPWCWVQAEPSGLWGGGAWERTVLAVHVVLGFICVVAVTTSSVSQAWRNHIRNGRDLWVNVAVCSSYWSVEAQRRWQLAKWPQESSV